MCVCVKGFFCQARHGQYGCTRVAGHDGDHVACGTMDNYIATWKDDKDAEIERLRDALSEFAALEIDIDSCGEWPELKAAWIHAKAVLAEKGQ